MGKKYGIVSYEKLNQNINNISIEGMETIDYSRPASVRGIDMLLAKYKGQPFESEIRIHVKNELRVPVLSKSLNEAKIALVTDGGLVPAGNPDNLPSSNADCFFRYPATGSLDSVKYEISHQGYLHQDVQENPNRLLPLDALQTALNRHIIGSISDWFYTTSGVMTSVEHSMQIGETIADALVKDNVDGVLLTSTCGTSTRCGALIARKIEYAGIPVTHITSLPQISLDNGVSRVLAGIHVCHVLGNPDLPKDQEDLMRLNLVLEALHMLAQTPPDDDSLYVNRL